MTKDYYETCVELSSGLVAVKMKNIRVGEDKEVYEYHMVQDGDWIYKDEAEKRICEDEVEIVRVGAKVTKLPESWPSKLRCLDLTKCQKLILDQECLENVMSLKGKGCVIYPCRNTAPSSKPKGHLTYESVFNSVLSARR